MLHALEPVAIHLQQAAGFPNAAVVPARLLEGRQRRNRGNEQQPCRKEMRLEGNEEQGGENEQACDQIQIAFGAETFRQFGLLLKLIDFGPVARGNPLAAGIFITA